MADDLTTRRVARTRQEILSTAVGLFVSRGYNETTMEDVADAVGVSRRTLYRYFSTKEDIVFEHPRRWLAWLEDVLHTRGRQEPSRHLLRRGLIDVATGIEQDPDPVLAAFSILGASPELAARHGASDAEWVQRYVAELAPDVGGDPDAMFGVLVLAMAIVAGQNAVIIQWASSYPDLSASDLMAGMLDQLDGAWPDACRRPRA